MFALQASFDASSEDFIDGDLEVANALAAIHESLTTQLFYEVIIASNARVQHIGSSYARNALSVAWQSNIEGILREKLIALGWSLQNIGCTAYIISPCKNYSIRVFTGNKYVGLKEGDVSNQSLKGSTLKNDIYSSLNFVNGTKLLTLLFHQSGELMRLELSQPKSFKNGKIDAWGTRIKFPDTKFNVPSEPFRHKNNDKFEAEVIPVKRKKRG